MTKNKKYLGRISILCAALILGCAEDSGKKSAACATPGNFETKEEGGNDFQQYLTSNTSPTLKLLVKTIGGEQQINKLREDLVNAHKNSAGELGKFELTQVDEDLVSVELPAASPAKEVLTQYINAKKIEYIEPDHPTFFSEVSEGPFNGGFSNNELNNEEDTQYSSTAAPWPNLDSIDLQGGSKKEVIVAVIDSGVDYTHKDLAPYMWKNPREIPNNGKDDDKNGYVDDVYGYDFANNDNNPMADDAKSYHGTHVAGIVKQAALLAEKGIKIKIMALKYLDRTGSGWSSNAIRAINYAIRQGANILNNSWGSSNRSNAVSEAIVRTLRAKALFVAAAGNGDSRGNGINIDLNPFYPAAYNYENVVSVAAADCCNRLTRWSNFGRTKVDLAAPGSKIRSARNGNTYGILSGTSMAAPYVTGVAAMIWSLRPDLSYREVKRVLTSTVKKGANFTNKVATGGQIDPSLAVKTALNTSHDPSDNAVPEFGNPGQCLL